MNSRRKGQRSFAKAMRYLECWPDVHVLPIYQRGRFAQAQPFDAMVFKAGEPVLLIEVRTNQWGVAKDSTRTLASLPGTVLKQIWLLRDGTQTPEIRQWNGSQWITQASPWMMC